MVAQRVRGAESRMEPRISNGPLRAQSKAEMKSRVFCDVRTYVSCQRYVSILESARLAVNRGGTTGFEFYPPLTESEDFVEGGFLYLQCHKSKPTACLHACG